MLSPVSSRARLLVVIVSFSLWNPTLSAKEKASSNPHSIQQLNQLTRQFIQSSPLIQAAEAQIQAAEAQLSGAKKPLNNPELAFDAERTDINTLTIGLSQTLDWHNKQQGLEQSAQFNLQVAKAQLAQLKLQKSTELLMIMGRIMAYQEITQLSERRTNILNRMSNLAQKRYQLGDIPQTEMQLTRLSLTEAVMQDADNQVALIQAKTDFLSLTGKELTQSLSFPDRLPKKLATGMDIESLTNQHPEVQVLHQQYLAARQHIKVADRLRKADPTIGFTTGQENNENLIGVSLSIPLQVRNNFQSQVTIAQAEALEMEQMALQAYRALLGQIKGARQQYELLIKTWNIWASQGRSSLQKSNRLLETQWQAGEMNTTDYLFQIQQIINTQITGSELHNNLWRSWINWLNHTNTLDEWLQDNSKDNNS